MKKVISTFSIVCLGLLCSIGTPSCTTTHYTSDPEGTTYQTLPAGYVAVMVAGISYYHYNNHYCRYWPGYGYVVVRPPYGRPPYHRPPARPPIHRPPGYKPKPEHPIHKPGRPGTNPPRPGRPSIQPVPSNPSVRPAPSRPSIQPVGSPRPSGGMNRMPSRGSLRGGRR